MKTIALLRCGVCGTIWEADLMAKIINDEVQVLDTGRCPNCGASEIKVIANEL